MDVNIKESIKQDGTIQMYGQTYFPLIDNPMYYVNFNGEVITTSGNKPRQLKHHIRKGMIMYTLVISGKTHNVRASRIAYCIRNGVSLKSIAGQYVFRNGDKLELHREERFGGEMSQVKRKMKKPEDGKIWVERARQALELFATWYEEGDINPLNKYVAQLKPKLELHAKVKWSLSETNAKGLVEEACSQFFLSICERNLIRLGIDSYLKRLMSCIYRRDAERRAKERISDSDIIYQSTSLDEWEQQKI